MKGGTLLDRLNNGEIIIGDGGMTWALEERGYVKAGNWTPEAVVEHPEAVRQLHREFLRAGSSVIQTFTFNASKEELDRAPKCNAAANYSVSEINKAACDIAKQVAVESDALVGGSISHYPVSGTSCRKDIIRQIREQVELFTTANVDFLVVEFHECIEDMERAIEVCNTSRLPLCATMCIGPQGDINGVSAGECAVRMANAGADVVGLNCRFGPFVSIETMKAMKLALDEANLQVHLMMQPIVFRIPEAGKKGCVELPEYPFALVPRTCTRWEIQKYARDAYNIGVRYIGGCCGFQAYHVRAMCEELVEERGVVPESHEKHDYWGKAYAKSANELDRAKANKEYWEKLIPTSGR